MVIARLLGSLIGGVMSNDGVVSLKSLILHKLKLLVMIVFGIVFFVGLPAKIFTYAETIFYYKAPDFAMLKHSNGVVQWKGGRPTSGNSGVLVNSTYYYCRVIKEGYSSCSPCYFTGKCDEKGKVDAASELGKRVEIAWFEYGSIGRIAFSVKMDGVEMFSFQDAVARYRDDVDSAKKGIAFCVLLFVLGMVGSVLYHFKFKVRR
ncbi:hypothetical protein IEZ30_07295 [Chromobacterium haemolyticum]|nr:hypothetical protein IEZ30_07295 [Chromobacterium haemolyticum]